MWLCSLAYFNHALAQKLFSSVFLIVVNLQVIDMLLFKGTEDLNNILEHAKQRHHIIGQYVVGPQGLVQDLDPKDRGMSNFLKNFYRSNYFWAFIVWQTCSLGV